MLRTHTCGDLRRSHLGERVTLCGWVQSVREHGALRFYDLRDQYGVTQLRASGDLGHLRVVPKESVVRVEGTVSERPEGTANPALATGEIEVNVESLEVLSECSPLPFEVSEWTDVREDLRLLHRYLDLRRPTLRQNILTRHRLERAARAALEDLGFIGVETPMLVRSTPEGSRDFVVPSRLHAGRFFALPQSPQLYKQILMIAGIDRYYQFARCFRDEDPRRGRQFVHTQIDLEMAFCTQEDVFDAVEAMVVPSLAEVFDKKVTRPFPRIPYDDAVARWGIDKPDTRFGMELVDVTDIVRACGYRIFREAAEGGGAIKGLALPGCAQYSRAEIAKLEEVVKIYQASGLAWARRSEGAAAASFERHVKPEEAAAILDRAGAGPEDLVVLCAGPTTIVHRALGQLRSVMGGRLGLIPSDRLDFLWITDFPMFEWDEESGRWAPMHHMFTMPREDHLSFLTTDPGAVRAQLYDLVCNGVELGSGSVRVHRPDLQRQIMEFVGLDRGQVEQQFGFLLRAYEYGGPPHAGIGIGFDNLVMTLLGLENIRDVIAFPNATGGLYPLDDSPAPITAEQLRELHLQRRSGK